MNATDAVRELVEKTARHEARSVLATVARLLGDVHEAEEIVQDVLLTALERWPIDGVPDKPGAWLLVAGRNRALDRLRRRKLEADNRRALDDEMAADAPRHAPDHDESEDELSLVFACCHPVLSQEAQVALTLRLFGGLDTAEIARALLTTEPTIAQRIVRAKRTLRDHRVAVEIPAPRELPERLPAVLDVIYLVFNEGYAASSGDALLRHELSASGIALGRRLAARLPGEPEVLGLLALMLLQASRDATRTGSDGSLVLLQDQDRSRWDRALIDEGSLLLERAMALRRPGPLQVEAAIAACHAGAASWPETDWPQIAALYDRLAAVAPSPIVDLNRAVAVSMRDGAEAGLALIDGLAGAPALRDVHHVASLRAHLLERLGRRADAALAYDEAASLALNERVRTSFLERAAACRSSGEERT